MSGKLNKAGFPSTIPGDKTFTGNVAIDGTLDVSGETVLAGTLVGTPSADQSLANDAAIAVNAVNLRVIGDGGAVVLDTDPAISDGSADGQRVLIQGTSDANTVQIADACNTGLSGGQAMTLGQGDTIELIWDSGDSLWYEISRSNN